MLTILLKKTAAGLLWLSDRGEIPDLDIEGGEVVDGCRCLLCDEAPAGVPGEWRRVDDFLDRSRHLSLAVARLVPGFRRPSPPSGFTADCFWR